MTTPRFGIIAGLVKDQLKEDAEATVAWLSQLGMRGIESGDGIVDLSPEAYGKLLQRHKMHAIGVPAKREVLRDELDAVIARAHLLEARYVLCYWAEAESAEQLQRDAELYNSAGARLAKEGLRLCYHNHEHELRTEIEGTSALEFLLEQTDPGALALELDVAWATFGGADPVDLMRRYPKRIPLLHLKDLHALDERGQFTALGTGVVDVDGCIRMAHEIGCDWLIFEQDKPRNLQPRDSVTLGMLILRERGWL